MLISASLWRTYDGGIASDIWPSLCGILRCAYFSQQSGWRSRLAGVLPILAVEATAARAPPAEPREALDATFYRSSIMMVSLIIRLARRAQRLLPRLPLRMPIFHAATLESRAAALHLRPFSRRRAFVRDGDAPRRRWCSCIAATREIILPKPPPPLRPISRLADLLQRQVSIGLLILAAVARRYFHFAGGDCLISVLCRG